MREPPEVIGSWFTGDCMSSTTSGTILLLAVLAGIAAVPVTAQIVVQPAPGRVDRLPLGGRLSLVTPPNPAMQRALDAAAAPELRPGLPVSQRLRLTRVVADVRAGNTEALTANWRSLLQEGTAGSGSPDVNDLVMQVLRESYLEQTADLRAMADRVRHFNAQKRLLRETLGELRDVNQNLPPGASAAVALPDPRRSLQDPRKPAIVRQPMRPLTKAQLVDGITIWEDRLQKATEDEARARTDLQQHLQKQPQALDLMSQTYKLLLELSTGIVRPNC
jgi:hypothetical protein